MRHDKSRQMERIAASMWGPCLMNSEKNSSVLTFTPVGSY
jgi:hypothetical protein